MGFWKQLWARVTKSSTYLYRRGFRHHGGTLIDEEIAMKVAAFNRGLIYISTQIAKLPFDIKDDNNDVMDTQISYLLNVASNREMSAFRFKMLAVQVAIVHGNFYAEIERNIIGTPIAFWPLETRRMHVLRDENGNLFYRYFNPTGGFVDMLPKDVLHIPNFHTKDGIIGQGIVSYASETLGIQHAADQMAGGLFINGGIPSGTLTHPGKISDEAYKRLKDGWADENAGYKSGKTQILEEGMKYEPVLSDPEALQFLQSRQFGILEIARFLGVPPSKVYDASATAYKNQEQANLEVATDTLHAWATNFESEIDFKVLSGQFGGRYSEMDLYYVFRGDMATRAAYYKDMMSIAAITPNQVREKEGMASYADGDKYYIANNNFAPVDRINDLIDAQIKSKTEPPAQNNDPQKTDEQKQLTSAIVKLLER